ncbi:DUF2280 domain-containing protein [Cupriavidus sp. SZY C1]|uniref:DUF2280 domain-containing protein n=1 Tax=Cupriavidus sp. SZY C1 TaxID=3055037 RepID=UPI0028B7913F|nr:DUF2280 domain-containing protein [Cupriavidus sp. SZY C1]MDT6962924.1 DUF2280 domain-containing protein [Cupriavidus sp. SZY C1]
MATLNDDVKAFIVQALACYDTPSQVVDAVKEEFGLEVSRMQVQAYDPTKAQGKALSQKWRDVFAATRDSFVKATAEIPIATQAYRLRVLNRLVSKAEKQGNMGMVSQLLEQAAKEAGGAFTNKQRVEHTGKDGAPIEQRTAVVNEHEVRAAVDKLESEY